MDREYSEIHGRRRLQCLVAQRADVSRHTTGATRRGREDDAATASGGCASTLCDDGPTEFTFWFNLFQEIEATAKQKGVPAALRYASEVTGWHYSKLAVRKSSGGIQTCAAKLCSGERVVDSVRGGGGLAREAKYSTEVELPSAFLQCATARTEETALQDGVLDQVVIERVCASLDMRRAALVQAAISQQSDVAGAYGRELDREPAVRGLTHGWPHGEW